MNMRSHLEAQAQQADPNRLKSCTPYVMQQDEGYGTAMVGSMHACKPYEIRVACGMPSKEGYHSTMACTSMCIFLVALGVANATIHHAAPQFNTNSFLSEHRYSKAAI